MGTKTIGRFTFDNASSVAVAADSSIPFPNVTVSTPCISCDGSTITINRSGAYLVQASFTFAAAAAGTVETQMIRNGNPVSGAHAISTVGAIGDLAPQAFSTIITVPRNAPISTLSFKAVSATNVRVADVTVVKVA